MGDVWSRAELDLIAPEAGLPATPPPDVPTAPRPLTPFGSSDEKKQGKSGDGRSDANVGVKEPASLTKSELDLLQNLAQRRDALMTREKELDLKESLLAAAAKQVDEKIATLKALEAKISGLLKQRDEEEEQSLRSLVKVYETMKPNEAARIFEQLDMTILLSVVERMKEAKLALVLAQVSPTKAKAVTAALVARRQMPGQGGDKALPGKAG